MLCKKIIFFAIILGILLNINIVFADFYLFNKSVQTTYSSTEPIRGYIVISFEDELAEAVLSGFKDNITLKNFLDLNSANYSCIPTDCKSRYSTKGSSSTSKTLNIDNAKKSIGVKLKGEVTGITDISFNLTTDAQESCLNPLTINVLDDDSAEWKADKVSLTDSGCSFDTVYGCYDDRYSNDVVSIVQGYKYCEKIILFPSKGYRIGANLIGGGDASFKMSLNSEKECTVTTTSGGDVSCTVVMDEAIEDNSEAEVCIYPTNLNGNIYKIKFESSSTCGYLENNDGETYSYDFKIFARGLKYEPIKEIKFNQGGIRDDSLGEQIWAYVYEKYKGNCTPECIIPISFIGTPQSAVISDLKLDYELKGMPKTENNIYDIKKVEPLIDAGLQKLELAKGNFFVPSENGTRKFILEIGGRRILSFDISIKKGLNIAEIVPQNPPILVPYIFVVLMEKYNSNMTYAWNFGDGSAEEVTRTNSTKHTYTKLGDYDLSVRVSDGSNEAVKTVKITTVNPKDYINLTIKNYRSDLRTVQSQILAIPDFVRREITKKVNLDSLETEINNLEKSYKEAIEDEEYATIMGSLVGLRIPYKLGETQIIKSAEVFQSTEQINFDSLEKIGAGTLKDINDETEPEYKQKINNWIINNLKIGMESKAYSIYYKTYPNEDQLFSYVKLTIEPKETGKDVYVIINENNEELNFKDELKTQNLENEATGIFMEDLTEAKTIEFIYPGKVELENLPFYFSPDLKELGDMVVVEKCNNNGVCDKGESYKDCSRDCKPFGLITTLIGILIFIALVIYIALQEWYKRYYESILFKDKNNLFNLINFMNNSESQGLKKQEIFDKLKKYRWTNEQVNYAWNKLHGKRTGMWEIPIFRIFEKRKMKQEIEKRKDDKTNPPKGV